MKSFPLAATSSVLLAESVKRKGTATAGGAVERSIRKP